MYVILEQLPPYVDIFIDADDEQQTFKASDLNGIKKAVNDYVKRGLRPYVTAWLNGKPYIKNNA